MRIALVSIGLLISVLILAQDRLNVFHPLDDYPGINVNQLHISGNYQITVGSLYREENTLSSTVLFKIASDSITLEKILGVTMSDEGLTSSNDRLKILAQDRKRKSEIQIFKFEDGIINRDTFRNQSSDDLFPVGSIFGINHGLYVYLSDFDETDERYANFVFENRHGQYTNYTYFDDLRHTYPVDLELSTDHNFLVSASIRKYNQYGSYAQVVKMDTSGQIVWRYDGEDRFEHGAVSPYISPLSNGEVVQTYQIQGDQAPHHRMVWLSEEGSFLRDSTIVVPGLNEMYFSDLVPGRGDYFYGHGVYNFYDGFTDGYYGMLTKMANDGSVLWTRYYKHESLHIPRGYHNVIDIHEKEDGKIIILMRAREIGTIGHMWLLEVDSEGCYTPDCDDLQIITSSEEVVYEPGDMVNIYPNPTTGTITVDLRNKASKGRIDVLDLHGRVIIADQRLVSGQAVMDLSNYQKGVYICRISLDSGERMSKKIILQ